MSRLNYVVTKIQLICNLPEMIRIQMLCDIKGIMFENFQSASMTLSDVNKFTIIVFGG